MVFTHTFRARLPSGILAEFLPPAKPSNRVIILCDGLPSVPSKKEILQHLALEGFWVFHMRYRGTWESDGEFLNESPDTDVNLVMRDFRLGGAPSQGTIITA